MWVWNVECGVWSVECGVWSVEYDSAISGEPPYRYENSWKINLEDVWVLEIATSAAAATAPMALAQECPTITNKKVQVHKQYPIVVVSSICPP